MAAAPEVREVDWTAVAAPIAAVAPWRPTPGADAREAGWAGRGFTRPGPEPDVSYQAGYAPGDAEARVGMVTISGGSAAFLTGPRRAPSVPGRQTGADGRTFHDRQQQ
jgi:hypothetical protein